MLPGWMTKHSISGELRNQLRRFYDNSVASGILGGGAHVRSMRSLKEGYAPLMLQSRVPEEYAAEDTERNTGFRKIVVAYDGSEFAKKALRVAESLAKQFGSTLIVVQVIADQSYLLASPSIGSAVQAINLAEVSEDSKQAAEKELMRLVRTMRRRNLNVRAEVRSGVLSVVNELTDYASNERADLIVVGTRGMGGLKKLLMGSVSEGLVAHANRSVLVVR
jgi:nucleotide-binding universal stress UspA family protein